MFQIRIFLSSRFYDFSQAGWFIRVYHNITREQSIEHKMLCDMYCNHPNVDLCDANVLIKKFREKRRREIVPITETSISRMNPRLWRYLPMMDSLVDRIMSRDIDAEIIEREATALKQWLMSNYTSHHQRPQFLLLPERR